MRQYRSNVAATAKQNSRLPVNIVSFLVTCVILFVAINVADGGFANSIDKITKNLDVALQDLMDDIPRYTNYTGKEIYVSSNSFHPKGMAGLYNLTNKFMDLILPPDFLMEGLIIIKDRQPQIGKTEVTEILKTYWGLLVMLIILAVMAVFIPFCGLCFCCCRCCGNCGARSQPCDKKRDLCKKILQGTLLIILGTALLFCVVCAFASNQQLQDGIDKFPENIQNGKSDAYTFLGSIKHEATHLLDTNYKEFSNLFISTMNKSSEYVMQQLEIWSNATAMMDLYSFVDNMPKLNGSLQILKTDTNSLRASASQLNDAMRKVKKDLLNTLQKCATPECDSIKNNISQLQTNIDFNKLPDVSPTINKINKLNITSLHEAAQEGKEKLKNIEVEIKNKLSATLQSAVEKVNEAGNTIKGTLDDISHTIMDGQKGLNESTDPIIHNITKYIKNYGQYRYYGGLAISCILLLITVCIALGLICGICGKRPDGYSDNCCNKGAGSQFLICAVMLMFIFGILVALITIVTFVLGVASDRVGCYPLRNPENSTIIKVIDEYIDQNSHHFNITIEGILINCRQNKSAYHVFNLVEKFDIDTIHQKFNISSILDNMNSLLDGIISHNFTILSPSNEKILEDLRTLEPSINFDQFKDELKQNFTNLSLSELSKKLEELVTAIEDKPALNEVKMEVQLSILHINTYDEKLLVPMKEMANEVIVIAEQLDTDLKMNSSSFSEAINKLLTEINEAQKKLQNEGSIILQKVATEFGEMVKNQVNSYLDRVTNVIKNDLGGCGPLNVVLNSTLIASCDKIILPWNGFWFSLFLSLILFIPTIIVCVKLASLYQKYKQYGQYVETRAGKRGKKKAKKSKKYEDRPQNMGGEVVTREYATGSHPPDTRYADMAPKHWEEFPNGGPPQYQRAPTEYERPPPYYYPGTGDQ